MNTQLSFSDRAEQERLHRLEKRNKLLSLNKHINWSMFLPILTKAIKGTPRGPGGRPGFDLILKFKMLILSRLYNFSDAELEFQVEDRSSFRGFLGITSEDTVPDEKTI